MPVVVGANVPVVTTTQSQTTPPTNITLVNTGVNGPQPVNLNANSSNIVPGTGAPSDDATINRVRVAVQAGTPFSDRITAQPNILDNYYSYNYVLTWYLCTSDAIAKVMSGDLSVLASQAIVMQSGGVNNDERSPYFDVDFYFDNLILETNPIGEQSTASMDSEMSFTVVEPAGITLIPRLRAAIKAMMGAGGDKDQSLGSQNYVMAIKFYGYDENGNLVQVGKPLSGQSNYALVEKFYPFQITDIEYKVENKLVEYHIKARPLAITVVKGQNQNSLMYNVEVSGNTVKEVLSTGTTVTTGQAAGPTTETTGRINESGATPKNTVRLGLMTALNQYQQDLVAKGVYSIPNTYVIEFADPEIANAVVAVKDGRTKGTGMPLRGSAADQRDPNRQSMDKSVRLIDFTAGQQITQIIDQTIRNSTYISNQSNLLVSETTQFNNINAEKNLDWFSINVQAIPKGYDPKRNDYAYTIRYVISRFKVYSVLSPYFKPSPFAGVVKEYNYWFTGLNTQILRYEQHMKTQHTIILGGDGGERLSESLKGHEDYKLIFSPRSGDSGHGAAGRTNDIAANAADFLYDNQSLNDAEIEIVGDPAWMAQGSLLSLPAAENLVYGGFYPDGSINLDSSQVLFEIAFSAPSDYDLSTGLMDPDTQINGIIDNVGRQNNPRQRVIYRTSKITSKFEKGKFTQTLKGVLDDELSRERQLQIDSMIGSDIRASVTDRTPARRALTTRNNATQTNATGLNYRIPTSSLTPTNNNNVPVTLDNTMPATPPRSNGDITQVPNGTETLVTNSSTQLINREA